jgi:predicted  nucleic acid-binding Zn-ribbon protein
MPLAEITCVGCGKRFTLLPKKSGLVNTCPQCCTPPVEYDVPERKPRKKRQKTANEIVRDLEVKLYNRQKLRDLISPKGRTTDT